MSKKVENENFQAANLTRIRESICINDSCSFHAHENPLTSNHIGLEYWSVTSFIFFFAFQHFHDNILVEHDEKPSHTKFDMNWFTVALDMAAWIPN